MNGPAFWIPPICLSHSSLPAPFLPLSAPSVPTLCPLPTIRGLLSLSRFSVPVPPKPPVSPFHSDPSVPPPPPRAPLCPSTPGFFSLQRSGLLLSIFLRPEAPLRPSTLLFAPFARNSDPSRPLQTPPDSSRPLLRAPRRRSQSNEGASIPRPSALRHPAKSRGPTRRQADTQA